MVDSVGMQYPIPVKTGDPPLGKFRLEAYNTHKKHGTTFGGRLNPQGAMYQERHGVEAGKEPAVSYNAGATNSGFDNPM